MEEMPFLKSTKLEGHLSRIDTIKILGIKIRIDNTRKLYSRAQIL